MADEMVTDYWLNYKINTNSVRVFVKTNESGWKLIKEAPPEQAVFLSDMLRNEKPLFYIRDVSLHTKQEPPGEAE